MQPREKLPKLTEACGYLLLGGLLTRLLLRGKPNWESRRKVAAEFGLDALSGKDRKQVEELLLLQAAALQSAANAIMITDRKGAIRFANKAFEKLTGYTEAEVLGSTPNFLKSDEQEPEVFPQMWETVLAGEVWQGELVNRRKDGSLYDEEMTVTPVCNAQGEITHFIAIKQDVTERKRAEKALNEARDALSRANAELERQVEQRTAQLIEANASLKTFAYTAAHDLRTPLRSIRSFSSLALEERATALGSEGRSMLERVVGAADRLGHLLDDLLEYSRMSQSQLRLQPVDLEAAVKDALALLDGEVSSRKAIITVRKPMPKVIGHPATVILLINNLVSNALKFTAPEASPKIDIAADQTATYARLYVQDSGIGISSQDLERIFDAFERLHGKEAYPGTGLGLSIVRKGAERMGGRVGVESEPGKGSRFWLELQLVNQSGQGA